MGRDHTSHVLWSCGLENMVSSSFFLLVVLMAVPDTRMCQSHTLTFLDILPL